MRIISNVYIHIYLTTLTMVYTRVFDGNPGTVIELGNPGKGISGFYRCKSFISYIKLTLCNQMVPTNPVSMKLGVGEGG